MENVRQTIDENKTKIKHRIVYGGKNEHIIAERNPQAIIRHNNTTASIWIANDVISDAASASWDVDGRRRKTTSWLLCELQ